MNADRADTIHGEFRVETAKQFDHAMPLMHYHEFYEIYIQDQGTRDMLVGTVFRKMNPGDVVLLKPNTLHQSLSLKPHVRTIVYFTDHFLQTYFSERMIQRFLSIFQYETLTLSAENYYKGATIVREMNKESLSCPDNMLFAYLAELFMIFHKNIRENPPTPPKESVPSDYQNLSPLISYVHENFLSLTNIDEIASTFYITPSHLCRTFKKLTGYTITQYINALKIRQACDLLSQTDKNITEIALDCGFNSTMYFCKTFKSILNVTPTEYRKTSQKIPFV